jgi:precorrin-2 dehydrogenase/sirohydrochlorin ferrochelatase
MSYFPAYLKFDNKKILVVGGGLIATNKIKRLLSFSIDITIISKDITPTLQQLIKQYSLKYINKSYQYGDIDGFFLVIVATNDITLQKEIFNECETKKILCNSVDSTKYCSFIFPSFIKQGDLTISFSTSGISPSVSKYLKKLILEILPKDIDKFLITLKHLRNTLPKGKQRQKLLDDKAKKYILGDKND